MTSMPFDSRTMKLATKFTPLFKIHLQTWFPCGHISSWRTNYHLALKQGYGQIIFFNICNRYKRMQCSRIK
jgi:hypothetical protein